MHPLKYLFLFFIIIFVNVCVGQSKDSDALHSHHQIMLPVILSDADHDGVVDQFDKEPDTPPGCPVDTHGVQLDTDGDCIPDCRDKEKLSRADCFPPDSNGIVSCPELN